MTRVDLVSRAQDVILLAQGAPERAPSSPWTGVGEEVQALATQWVRWAAYLGLFVAVLSAIILAAMIMVDKNRGEAGIASSDQARWLKWALGIGVIITAPQFISWMISSVPW